MSGDPEQKKASRRIIGALSYLPEDFVGSKKVSKVIHIGLEHKKILDILDEEFVKNDSSTLITSLHAKIKMEPQYCPIAPKATSPIAQTATSVSSEALTSKCYKSSQDVTPRAEGRGLDEREDEGDAGPRQQLLQSSTCLGQCCCPITADTFTRRSRGGTSPTPTASCAWKSRIIHLEFIIDESEVKSENKEHFTTYSQ